MLKIWESSYDEHMLILLTVSRYSTKDYHYNSWNGKCEKPVETKEEKVHPGSLPYTLREECKWHVNVKAYLFLTILLFLCHFSKQRLQGKYF